MNIDITMIVLIVFAVLALITGIVLWPWIKSKTTSEQQDFIKNIVRTLVHAAEQMFTGSERGEEKLAYVEEELAKLGVKADRNAIEAAVYEMKENTIMIAE